MRVRVRVDILEDATEGEGNPLDLPCGEFIGGTVYAPKSGEMTAIGWVKLAAQAAMGIYKQARKIKPDICAATYALRLAENTVSAIDSEDLMDLDPTADVKREQTSRALAHGEAAAYKRGSK